MHRILIIALAAGVAASAFAQQPQLLADANHDGKITPQEYQDSRRKFILKADADKDGRVSQAEWTKGATILRQRYEAWDVPGAAHIGHANGFAELDADKNGFVTGGEIDGFMLARFNKADPNKDGAITAAEARQIEKSIPKPR